MLLKNQVLKNMSYKNTISKTVLPCFAVLALTACESLHYSNFSMKDHDLFSTDAGPAQRQVEDNMSTKPNESKVFGDSLKSIEYLNATNNVASESSPSIEIYDMELNPAYQRGVAGNAPMMNRQMDSSVEIMPMTGGMGMSPQSGGYMPSSDSSVTIFDLDGGAPMNMAQQYGGQNNYGQNYAQNNYGAGQAAGQIFFKHGSSRLGSGDMRKISALADQAKFAPVNYITVEGFASRPTAAGSNSTQAHIINLRQSMKRSEKVSMALVKKGVPGEKIKTVSWGATKATGNNRQDRRVDVVMGDK